MTRGISPCRCPAVGGIKGGTSPKERKIRKMQVQGACCGTG